VRVAASSPEGKALDCIISYDGRDAGMTIEQIRMMVLAHDGPVSRLERDIENVADFLCDDPLSSQRRLLLANPPFTPPAAAIVNSIVTMLTGSRRRPAWAAILKAVARQGPITMAENFILKADRRHVTSCEGHALAWAFRGTFIRYPEVFLGDAKEVLERFMLSRMR